MKISFNEATTMKYSTLEKDLFFAEKYGYDFIEIRSDKLKQYLETYTLEKLLNFFEKSRIKPLAINALESINLRTAEDYAEIKKECKRLCDIGNKLNCRKLVVVPSFGIPNINGAKTLHHVSNIVEQASCLLPYKKVNGTKVPHYVFNGVTSEDIRINLIEVLNELADIADKYDMNLAFEFVGYPNCTVNTFGHAYEIVKVVDRENVGLVLDCFHFYAMGSKLEDLKNAEGRKIFIFHIDDAEDLPIGTLTDANRLLPGDGVIPLAKIIKILQGIGYDGPASVELFRPEYWEWDIEKTISFAKEKTEKVLRRCILNE